MCVLLLQLKQQLLSSPEHRETIGNDVVGQAHVEAIALRMFQAADSQDRDGKFSRQVIGYLAFHLIRGTFLALYALYYCVCVVC